MLLDKQKKRRPSLAVVTRNREVTKLLTAVFENWKYELTDHLPSAGLVFVEWGIAEPIPADKRVWLAPLEVAERHLKIPLSLVALYRCIEEQFFPKPRTQMRISLKLPAKLFVAGQMMSVELSSLSGRGARLICPEEPPPGESLAIEVVLGVRSLYLPGEVLYQLPAGDVSGKRAVQLGVLFRLDDAWLSATLALYVERVCAEKACALAGITPQDACLSWLALPSDPWGLLP